MILLCWSGARPHPTHRGPPDHGNPGPGRVRTSSRWPGRSLDRAPAHCAMGRLSEPRGRMASMSAAALEQVITAMAGPAARPRPDQVTAVEALVEQRRRVLVVQATGW